VNAMKRYAKYLPLYAFHLFVARPIVRWLLGVRYRRKYLVPKGPCLIVANHNSHLDAGVLMSLFPLRRLSHVHPVAAADYFGKTWLRRTMAMMLMNGISIDRNPLMGQDPLAPLVKALEAGESLIFFPEGSRGEAGVVGPFRAGVGRLVRSLPGLLVVPVFMSGPERIWPRGQLIPMPLGIDANVGKPRSYPASTDAREIAEQVRRDVLALAPPPPPVPGPRPAPPVRVAVCGVEASSRHEVFLEITRRLGSIDRALGIGAPILHADTEGVHEATGGIPVARSRRWPSLLAWAFQTGGLYKGARFAEMVERARIDEALDHGRSARFVVGDGSALVDLLAWADADFYAGVFDEKGLHQLMLYLSGERRVPAGKWWLFIRKAPEVWLLNIFDLARPPLPDLMILVTFPAALAMERIRSRGESIQPHENETFLAKLQDGYRQVAGVVARRKRMEVLEFDGAKTPTQEIGARVEEACRRFVVEADKLAKSS